MSEPRATSGGTMEGSWKFGKGKEGDLWSAEPDGFKRLTQQVGYELHTPRFVTFVIPGASDSGSDFHTPLTPLDWQWMNQTTSEK